MDICKLKSNFIIKYCKFKIINEFEQLSSFNKQKGYEQLSESKRCKHGFICGYCTSTPQLLTTPLNNIERLKYLNY